MSTTLENLKSQLKAVYIKLLRAEVNHNLEKVRKHEQKVIKLLLKIQAERVD